MALSAAEQVIAQHADPLFKLNSKQRQFCIEYVSTGNASESARRAGYAPKSAGVEGRRLRDRDDIQEAIKALLVAQALANGVTEHRVVAEIALLAFDTTESVGARDKLKALEMLSRYLGLFDDKLDITINKEAIERAAREAGVSVDVLEAEYREITSGNS